MSDDSVQAQLERLGHGAEAVQAGNGTAEPGGYGDSGPNTVQMARPVTGEEGTR